ncbi:terminase small subunit [Mycobacterium phage Baee]|uniref:Adenylate kinase n=1 Tax=Mycobacterium phage Baee TaxID=1647306 RepID=A0A0F6YRW9_9CAUD|nr:terminase small subunit [Mycobacterium phage Baee]AKF14574.1 adenylate kinase [Mycobacterium phage Baee]
MSPRLIFIVGGPGSGKSQLMADLTAPYQRIPVNQKHPEWVLHDMLRDPATGAVIGAELGQRRGLFAGTDTLASAIIDKAVPWIEVHPYDLILAEGARLATPRFLQSALDAGYDVTVALLDHDQAEPWREERARKLKRVQNEAYVEARRSSARSFADTAIKLKGRYPVRVWIGHPDDMRQGLQEIIADG